VHNTAKVNVFGSFASGLYLPSSDIDLVVSGTQGLFLESLLKKMQAMKSVESVFHIPNAAVPVLKIKMYVNNHPVNIDISVEDNRHGGLKCVDFVKKLMNHY